jgi:hypothetical protein
MWRQGGVVFLRLHGGACGRRFTRAQELLSRKYQVAAFEMPGVQGY